MNFGGYKLLSFCHSQTSPFPQLTHSPPCEVQLSAEARFHDNDWPLLTADDLSKWAWPPRALNLSLGPISPMYGHPACQQTAQYQVKDLPVCLSVCLSYLSLSTRLAPLPLCVYSLISPNRSYLSTVTDSTPGKLLGRLLEVV